MGNRASAGGEGFADFADFQSATANGDFNPRSQSVHSQGKHGLCLAVTHPVLSFVMLSSKNLNLEDFIIVAKGKKF